VQKQLVDFKKKKDHAFFVDVSLQIAIDRYLEANNAKLTEEEARNIFNIEWNNIESEIKK
jgi:hypothetical protein